MNINESKTTIKEWFTLKWEQGAAEYFPSLDAAVLAAKKQFVRKPTMTDENWEYWKKQTYTIRKEITITEYIQVFKFESE